METVDLFVSYSYRFRQGFDPVSGVGNATVRLPRHHADSLDLPTLLTGSIQEKFTNPDDPDEPVVELAVVLLGWQRLGPPPIDQPRQRSLETLVRSTAVLIRLMETPSEPGRSYPVMEPSPLLEAFRIVQQALTPFSHLLVGMPVDLHGVGPHPSEEPVDGSE